jgi:hypothetical protein
MANILQWPDEFTNSTPLVAFGSEFSEFLERMVAAGTVVSADEHWTIFSFRRGVRTVEFFRRGKLVQGSPECWEVRPVVDGECLHLGQIFGIREHACVVTAGLAFIQRITEGWLNGQDIGAVLRGATFWDKMNPSAPLELPTPPSG